MAAYDLNLEIIKSIYSSEIFSGPLYADRLFFVIRFCLEILRDWKEYMQEEVTVVSQKRIFEEVSTLERRLKWGPTILVTWTLTGQMIWKLRLPAKWKHLMLHNVKIHFRFFEFDVRICTLHSTNNRTNYFPLQAKRSLVSNGMKQRNKQLYLKLYNHSWYRKSTI